jgi:hypothetical protein
VLDGIHDPAQSIAPIRRSGEAGYDPTDARRANSG